MKKFHNKIKLFQEKPEKEDITCPACKSDQLMPIEGTMFQGHVFTVYKCMNCGKRVEEGIDYLKQAVKGGFAF